MDSNVMVLLKYGVSSLVARFDQFVSLESLVEFICSRWDCLEKENVSMSYVLGQNPCCMLASEQDFICMGIMVDRKRIDIIEINVVDRSISVGNDALGESSTSVYGGSFVSIELENSSSSSRNGGHVSFFRHKEKKLKSAEWADAIQSECQIFEGGCAEFRIVLCKFATEVGFDFEYLKNEPGRVTAQCLHKVSKWCPWRIHASLEKSNGYFYKRSYEPKHICKDVVRTDFGQRMGSDVLSSVLIDKVRVDPNISPSDIIKELQTDYGLQMPYKVVWRAVEKAKKIVFGDSTLAYNKLRSYFEKIKELDPNSYLRIESDPETSRFKRCFVAFGACLHGFTFCRPLLFLDGTFLTGKYRGTLLAATAKDGDNGLFHVAFAIVGSEDIDNWSWFLDNLRPHIAEREVTFISDRHQGIITSVKEIMPFSHHSFCLFHLRNNLRYKLGGLSSDARSSILHKFSLVAKAPTPELFQFYLNEIINEGGTKVQDFLSNLPKENFATAYFGGRRYGEMCSNAAESFNAMIKDFKSLPAVELVDQIRLKIMVKMSRLKQGSANWSSVLCPSMQKKYKNCVDKGRSWGIHSSNEYEFEVHSDPTMVVNLPQFMCSCGMWQHEGFPCVHAIAVLSRNMDDASSYIENFFQNQQL